MITLADDILWSNPVGIKRKAIIAAPTICRFCRRHFLDKWYKGERIHKVRCEHCHLVNAEVDIDDWMRSYYQGLRHSIGTLGTLGFHIEGNKFKEAVRKAYDFKTEEELQQKLKEFEWGMKEKARHKKIEEERKKRRETKITVKRKGEEQYQLGKKSKKNQTKQEEKQ
jgi:hypothetical protein